MCRGQGHDQPTSLNSSLISEGNDENKMGFGVLRHSETSLQRGKKCAQHLIFVVFISLNSIVLAGNCRE